MKEVYKTFTSSDGFEILVGNQARDNDYSTFKKHKIAKANPKAEI